MDHIKRLLILFSTLQSLEFTIFCCFISNYNKQYICALLIIYSGCFLTLSFAMALRLVYTSSTVVCKNQILLKIIIIVDTIGRVVPLNIIMTVSLIKEIHRWILLAHTLITVCLLIYMVYILLEDNIINVDNKLELSIVASRKQKHSCVFYLEATLALARFAFISCLFYLLDKSNILFFVSSQLIFGIFLGCVDYDRYNKQVNDVDKSMTMTMTTTTTKTEKTSSLQQQQAPPPMVFSSSFRKFYTKIIFFLIYPYANCLFHFRIETSSLKLAILAYIVYFIQHVLFIYTLYLKQTLWPPMYAILLALSTSCFILQSFITTQ